MRDEELELPIGADRPTCRPHPDWRRLNASRYAHTMPPRPPRRSSPARVAPARITAPPVSAAPPTWRDPWAWCVVAGVLPLIAKCWGAPLGEPVAEDFDFLHRSLFHGVGSFFDGGGSQAFWRPLAHQGYYALLGRLVVSHPLVVAMLHVVLLVAGSLLLYRVFRLGFEGPVAAMAAAFPLMAESTRTIVGWPTQFVDLGMFLFSALALHEMSRRRLPSAIAALLAALLCKEVSIVTAMMLPFLPVAMPRRERWRVGLASTVTVAIWAIAYLAVRRAAHLELPHGLERGGALTASGLTRMSWALASSTRAILSLDLLPGPKDLPAFECSGAVVAAAAAVFAASAAARARLVACRAWLAWGVAWFVIASAALTPIYPLWQPNRSQAGSVGVGAALTPVLAAAHPALAAGLAGTRLVLLGLSAGATTRTSGEPPETGAFMDFAHLSRLQHFMRATRTLLHATHPNLPPHANVVLVNMPHLLLYAYGGDQSLQAWRGDSTLHLLSFDVFQHHLDMPVACVLQYQPWQEPELVSISPLAIRVQEDAWALLQAEQFERALAAFARADSLERDPRAIVFRANNAALRSFAYEASNRFGEARREAVRALAIDAHNRNARLVMVAEAMHVRAFDAADAHLDSLLADYPHDAKAEQLRGDIAAARAGSAAPALRPR